MKNFYKKLIRLLYFKSLGYDNPNKIDIAGEINRIGNQIRIADRDSFRDSKELRGELKAIRVLTKRYNIPLSSTDLW